MSGAINKDADGLDFVWVDPAAATELGRLMAYPTLTPFTHPILGPFNSMEGFWYYVGTQERDDKLRELWGSEARTYGKKMTTRKVAAFREILVTGVVAKIQQSPRLRELIQSEPVLPFRIYYLFGPQKLPIRPTRSKLTEGILEQAREIVLGSVELPEIDYTQLLKT